MSTSRRVERRGAFTLIEVLVVVAIIALLISILLPSLRQAREMARLTVCLTHQKNIGNGIQMYWAENKDTMPGPIHPMFLAHPEEMIKDKVVDTKDEKFVVSGYINTRLRKYMGDSTYGKGQNMRDVGIDPSFPIPDQAFKDPKGDIPVYHYAINSSDITAPWRYFGFTHAGITSQSMWDEKYGGMPDGKVVTNIDQRNQNSPKKLGKIFSGRGPGNSNWRFAPASEWLMADAFRRPMEKGQAGNWPAYDEPNCASFSNIPEPAWKENAQWGSLSNLVHGSGDLASAKVAPFQPYHAGGGFRVDPTNHETIFKGKISTLFFDMHADALNEWKGTKFQRRMLGNQTTLRD